MKTNVSVITIPDFMVFLKQFQFQDSYTTSELQYKTFITYSHLSHVRNKLKDLGLVRTEKKGRIVNIIVTEKGKDAIVYINGLFSTLGITENNLNEFRAKTKWKHKTLGDGTKPPETKIKETVIEKPQIDEHKEDFEKLENTNFELDDDIEFILEEDNNDNNSY